MSNRNPAYLSATTWGINSKYNGPNFFSFLALFKLSNKSLLILLNVSSISTYSTPGDEDSLIRLLGEGIENYYLLGD